MIQDRNIQWLRTVKRIPYDRFGLEPSHTHAVGTVTGGALTTSGEGMFGMDTGAPQIAEVSTFGYGGIEIGATGDAFAHLNIELPPEIDPTEEIGARVLWTTNGAVATTDSVTWVVTYDQADVGEALAAPATALNTAIAAQTPSAATLLLRRTSRGIINANTFDETFRKGALAIKIAATTSGFSANEVVFLGLELDYKPRRCASAYEDTDAFSTLAASA